jgi:PKD repeat protein
MLVATDENIVYNSDCHALFLPIFSPDSNQVFFLNFSTAGVVQTLWDFGDGTTSDQLMPAHQYETPDIYTVTLTIVTAGGCENSYTAIINIAGANFTAAPEYEFRSATDAGEEEWLPETVRLYPNPVGDQLWIDLEDHPGGPTRWRILSLGGKLVQQGQQEMSAGHQKFSVSTADLPAGLYVLQIVGKNGMIGRKFVKY